MASRSHAAPRYGVRGMSEMGTAAKQAAVEQWTADPCGSDRANGELGSRPYFLDLLRTRDEYAPWTPETLDYEGARGLDVLDVGCGQGIDLARYAQGGAQVTGIDLSPRNVALSWAHLGTLDLSANVLVGDAEALPFMDESFDRVSSNGVLHHTPNMEAALLEIRRVLRPGGEMVVIVYNRMSLHYWVQQVVHEGILRRKLLRERSMKEVLSAGVEVSTIGARPLVRPYSPRQLRRMLRRAGFDEVSTEVRHFFPWDTFVTESLRRRGMLRNPRHWDRIGRIAGWYVVGRGVRAT